MYTQFRMCLYTIGKVCEVISGDIEAPEPLHGANTRRDGCDAVASHIERLQTRKESYLCRKEGGREYVGFRSWDVLTSIPPSLT